MNAHCTRFALAWLLSVGVGCTSAPIRYYTLISPPDRPLAASEANLMIDVRIVHLPAQLNRSELMVRTGPAETALLENEQWASPVKEEIEEALRLDLKRRLGGLTGLPRSERQLALDIDVQRLEAELGRYALLEASWSAGLSGAGGPPVGTRVERCSFRADREIHGGFAAIVEGYQQEIAGLADAIAAVLASSARGRDGRCQITAGSMADESGSESR